MSLILNRHAGQEIVIGDDIKVKVIRVRGHQVMLAIDAPITVTVDRLEVYLQKQQQKNENNKNL